MRRWVRRPPTFMARIGSGDGLYGNSLVALDARTGEKKWHRQLVHHDLWDYDLAAPPALFDIRRGGRVIPAVAADHQDGFAVRVRPRDRASRFTGWKNARCRRPTVPGEVTSQDAAVSAEASAAGEEHVPHGGDVRPVAGACTLLQGIVRNKSDEDRRAVHAAAARRQRAVFPEHAGRRKLGRRVGRSLAWSVVRERDEHRPVGAHGEAGRGVRADVGLRALRAVLESRDPHTVPESAVRRADRGRSGVGRHCVAVACWGESRRWKRSACAIPGR